MAIESTALIIVLGLPGTTVLDVGTAEQVLQHVTSHLVAHANEVDAEHHLNLETPGLSRPRPHYDAGQDRLLRFYTADGERLRLDMLSDWWTLVLEPTGEYRNVAELEADVHSVFEVDRPAMLAAIASSDTPGLTLPPKGTWLRQLDALHALFREFPNDRQGWPHNFFVHGWG